MTCRICGGVYALGTVYSGTTGCCSTACMRRRIAELESGLKRSITWLERIQSEYPGSLNHDAIDKHLRPLLKGSL